MDNDNVDLQLVSAHKYCQKAEEQATRTWKNHFSDGPNSVDDGFPMYFWDQLYIINIEP